MSRQFEHLKGGTLETLPATRTMAPGTTPPDRRDEKLMSLARELEASFLNEMLKSAGVGRVPDGFGGGAGEDHFSSFLTRAYATAAVKAGGIGLSEAIYRSLVAQGSDQA